MNSKDPEVIVLGLKKRFSGVSSTIHALLPVMSQKINLTYVGHGDFKNIPDLNRLSLMQAILVSRKKLPNGKTRIWHVRRNKEMLIGVILRDVLRLPIKLVFTSASIRKHSSFPRWLISKMDTVIATSEKAAAFIKNRCVIVEHGVNTDNFSFKIEKKANQDETEALLASKEAAWTKLELAGKYGIGTFGRVREGIKGKGTEMYVDAMINLLPKHQEFCAVIAGLCKKSDHEFLLRLKEKIKKANLEEKIIFLGEIPYINIPSIYQACLICVACPYHEEFGLTVPEAMASKCATVATRTGIFPKAIGRDDFLVNPGDTAGLINSLEKLMQDKKLAANWALSCRKRVKELFDVEREADGIIKAYKLGW